MTKKIPLLFLSLFLILTTSCEDYYAFEANKLNKKANVLINEANSATNIEEKISFISQALEKLNKLQENYPKTKISKKLIKDNKINHLSGILESLKEESQLENIEKEKKEVLNDIKKKIDMAEIELKRRNFTESTLLVLDAAEESIFEISDSRSKIRLLNKISQERYNIGDKDGALNTILKSLNLVNEMHVDLPKKIIHLSKIYEILYLLEKKEKYLIVEKKIYEIINNEITFDDNKSVALSEIAKSNERINNLKKTKIDIKKALGLSSSSAAYLEIANIQNKIGDLDGSKKTLLLAKKSALSTKQEFWNVRELINIAIFENSINLNESSKETLLEAEKFIKSNPDERIILELIQAAARIGNINQAKSLVHLIKPDYEKAFAMSVIGKELGIRNNLTEMNIYLEKAMKLTPDLVAGNYDRLGLPGFSTKGRILFNIAKSYARIGNFDEAYKLLGLIESDRFYKEGIYDVLYIQSKKNKEGARKKALQVLNFGGNLLDNKFVSKIAVIQSIAGDIENSFNTINQVSPSVDLSDSLINIAIHINPQQEDPLT